MNLAWLTQAVPEGAVWAATGIGRFQFAMNQLAIVTGGHVRDGLEDNLFFDVNKTCPATNHGLVKRLVDVAKATERSIASPAETRRMIGISPPPKDQAG